MSQQDLTADMLTRIRNAVRNKAEVVKCLNSKLNRGVAGVLQSEGYIDAFDIIDDGRQGVLRVRLRYGPRGEQIINEKEDSEKPLKSVIEDYAKIADSSYKDNEGGPVTIT